MHAAMQPREKGGTELPPRGVRPAPGSGRTTGGPPWPPPSRGQFVSRP